MKAILITMKSKWCQAFMNGEKTLEIRTSKSLANATRKLIAEQGKAKIIVACSKDNKETLNYNKSQKKAFIYDKSWQDIIDTDDRLHFYLNRHLNGKVLFSFDCPKVEDIKYHFGYYDIGEWAESYILGNSCLTSEQLDNYLGASKDYDETKPSKIYGYSIHIENLKVFDKPKEIGELMKPHTPFDIAKVKCFKKDRGMCNNGLSLKTGKWIGCNKFRLTKAPQNFCYIEWEE